MKSVLITGAHGFIGRHLARYCKSHWSSTVSGLGHGSFSGSELERLGMTTSINGDVSFANLERVAAEAGIPDVIFHLAGGSSVGPSFRIPHEDFKRTVTSTCELLDWVRTNAAQTKVVLSSSAAVYGTEKSKPIDELATTVPYSPYGYHKRMAELLCESYSRNFGLKTSVVRLFSVYGPELRKQLLWDTCQRLATDIRRLELHGSGHENRDWLHVSDCISFLCKVAEVGDEHFVFNCGTGNATSVEQVVQTVCVHWGTPIACKFNGVVRQGDPTDLVADNTRAKSLGWMPKVSWQEGIAEYVKWFQQSAVAR